MKYKWQYKKEITALVISFFILATLSVGSKLYGIYNISTMDNIITDIYEHPLKVSNAALTVQLDVYKMHRDMKDIVLSPENLDIYIKKVNQNEKKIYKNLTIIEKNILGEEGKILNNQARELFKSWKPIRDEVISLVKNNKVTEAISITKNKGAEHVLKLDSSAQKLYAYAQIKATSFKNKSNELFKSFETINFIIIVLILAIFFVISYYVVRRISKYGHSYETLNEELNKKSYELRTIIEETPTPMIIHDDSGKFIMINKALEELTGYKLDEINTIAKWSEKVAKQTKEQRIEYIKTLYSIDKRVDEGEFNIVTKNGNKLVWRFSSSPIGVIDGKRKFVTSAMDITESKKKDELMISQSRHAAMGEMISMIAHQWRQPLGVISMDVNNMLVDIELDDIQKSSFKNHLTSILEQGDYLTATIDDFRNFFSPNQEKEEVKMETVLDDTLKIIDSSLKHNNILVTTDIKSISSILIYKRELIQVLINVINNARDALVENTKNKRTIAISVSEDENNLMIEICDNGGGIEQSIIKKIFEPYFTTKEDLNGSGIGLYMSKVIIENHFNGNINVKNYDKGSCFTISIKK